MAPECLAMVRGMRGAPRLDFPVDPHTRTNRHRTCCASKVVDQVRWLENLGRRVSHRVNRSERRLSELPVRPMDN